MISKTVLVLAEDFAKLDAAAAAKALARGLEADGRWATDLCALPAIAGAPRPAGAQLDERDFDSRLRAARCLVVVAARLDDATLAGSVAFEAATRARQGGVPAYAATARDQLDPFEARIVDLQVILEAGNTRALAAAGRKLAALV